MFGFPRRAATGNTMCRSSAGWRPSKSSEARTFLGLATSDSPTFAGLTVAGLSKVTGEAGLGATGYPGSVGFSGTTTTHYTGDGTGWTWRVGYRSGGATTTLLSIDDSYRYWSILGSAPGTAGAGEVRIGGGQLDAADSITSGGTLSSIITDSATATQVDGLVAGHRSTGTPAAGFGSNVRWVAESTTTNDRTQGLIEARWVTATDASRTARLSAYVADAAATREAWRIEADGSAVRIGFLGASAVARQSVGSAATDAATTQTLANNIRAALISLGLCQT